MITSEPDRMCAPLHAQDLAIRKQRLLKFRNWVCLRGFMAVFQDLELEIFIRVNDGIQSEESRTRQQWMVFGYCTNNIRKVLRRLSMNGVNLNLFIDEENMLNRNAYERVFDRISIEVMFGRSSLWFLEPFKGALSSTIFEKQKLPHWFVKNIKFVEHTFATAIGEFGMVCRWIFVVIFTYSTKRNARLEIVGSDKFQTTEICTFCFMIPTNAP